MHGRYIGFSQRLGRLSQVGDQRRVVMSCKTEIPTPEDLASLGKVAALVKATQQVLLCRVTESVTKGDRWVTGLKDYLAACAR